MNDQTLEEVAGIVLCRIQIVIHQFLHGMENPGFTLHFDTPLHATFSMVFVALRLLS